MIRAARVSDLKGLVDLENRCFQHDRLSKRQFRYMLTRAHADTLVEERRGRLVGYVLVLFRRATSLGRVYSIAVDPAERGRGIGQNLLEAAEGSAIERGCAYLRLETQPDNAASNALYHRMGYRPFGVVEDYYEDGSAALRMEKALAPQLEPKLNRVPYYEQTLDFTCGASALMMALKALDPAEELDRRSELRIWREATTIFMASGHGGCGPLGLALAAARRGFRTEVYVNDEGVPMIDSVRSPTKKEVMRLVHEDMLEEAQQAGIPVIFGSLALSEIKSRFEAGAIPLVLISSYRLSLQKVPHWVVVTGFGDRFVYVHDPYVDHKRHETATDSMNTPIEHREFAHMARYGRAGLQALVMVYARSKQARNRRARS